ncbi:MAG: hypothetical protein JW955_18005 [Sedimentisphaerales bacterium]|nr:hypothetical protein [Sedimentisphaerales bacterium]
MVAPAEQWLRSQGLLTKKEFPTPWGICDLVGCSLNRNKVRKRLALRQTRPIRSSLRVHLLSLIPDETDQRTASIDVLHESFTGYLDRERIEIELDRLLRDRFIEQPSHGAYFKRNGWMPLHKRLVAIELKLTRIDDALHQAINNLGFVDGSYVGLPSDRADRLMDGRRRSDFQDRGIGVLAIGAQRCSVVLRARRQAPTADPVIQAYSVERFWPTYLKGTEA